MTEFGCCTYAGAADRGALGWAVVDDGADPPRLTEDLVRDEEGQATYLREVLATLEDAGVDGAFWFTFAGYERPHRADPRHDLDLASFGLVKVLDGPTGRVPACLGSRRRPSGRWPLPTPAEEPAGDDPARGRLRTPPMWLVAEEVE